MFRVLRLLADNLRAGPATVRLPGAVCEPPGFRGAVAIDPGRCLACRTCAYVCVSGAITGTEEGGAYAWAYEPGRCTFCARCVDHCPGHALTMTPTALPSYSRPGERAVRHLVAFSACPECGAPVRPVTADLLARAFGEATAEMRDLLARCERCRRRRLQRNLAGGAVQGTEEPR